MRVCAKCVAKFLALNSDLTAMTQIGLESTWSDFLAGHWLIGGIIASLLWFLAGRQSLSNQKVGTAIAWQSVAVLIIVILCAWAVVRKEWLGFACGLAVLYLEIRSIRRLLAIQNQQK
jgi:hypothetical protein